jgi:riboflavin kinase / FMN adenylyltransferase
MITFHPDPWVVIKNIKKVEHLTTMKDRMDLVENLGIDIWIILNFTKELSECTPESFLEDILCQLPIDALIYGYDFRFGHREQEMDNSSKNTEVIVLMQLKLNRSVIMTRKSAARA